MHELAVLIAACVSLVGLYYWRKRFEPDLILAAVQILERPELEPEPPPRPLAVASLKVWQTDYGRAMKPVSRPSTRGLVLS